MASSYCSCKVGIIILTMNDMIGKWRTQVKERVASFVFRFHATRNTQHATMPLPIKLISTDFDGTLHAEFEDPPVPHDLQALIGDLQRQGAKWVINTGRDLSSVMEGIARARLSIRPDYLVVVEREIYCHQESRYVQDEKWNHHCKSAHRELFARVQPDVPRLVEWVNKRFSATLYEDDFSPFCLIAERNEDADAIQLFLESYCAQIPHLTFVRNDVYARFSHVAYNKGTAL